MSAPSNTISSAVGSILLMDSSIVNTQTGVLIRDSALSRYDVSGTLMLDNVQATNVQAVVRNFGKFDHHVNLHFLKKVMALLVTSDFREL